MARYRLALILISLTVFLSFGASTYVQVGTGFPLDDAWIHQAYARNLALDGDWAFQAGQPSAGGTSFLWVLLLSIGHLLHLPPVIWSAMLGFALITAMVLMMAKSAESLLPQNLTAGFAAGLLLLDWHLLWAAHSGMETLLLGCLALALLVRVIQAEQNRSQPIRYWVGNALLLGAASITRPDGITLIGPLIVFLIGSSMSSGRKLFLIGLLVLIPVILYAPYAAINWGNTGSMLPSTFFAKQSEYAVLLEQGLVTRFLNLIIPLIAGVGILLVPGFIFLVLSEINKRRWGFSSFGIWVVGYIGIYVWRLPLAYQHGRYVMPVLPVFLLLGGLGSFRLVEQIKQARERRVVQTVVWGSAIAVQLVFLFLGARALWADTFFIESQMIATANWVSQNFPPGSRIAAHDIGALGYFAEIQLYDLAGLVNPEVIPFIQDESRLSKYLDQNEIEYLIAFPDWYPFLSERGDLIYESPEYFQDGKQTGGLAVFRWQK